MTTQDSSRPCTTTSPPSLGPQRTCPKSAFLESKRQKDFARLSLYKNSRDLQADLLINLSGTTNNKVRKSIFHNKKKD